MAVPDGRRLAHQPGTGKPASARPPRRAIASGTVLKTRPNIRSSTISQERSMSHHPSPWFHVNTATKNVTGVVLDGFVYNSSGSTLNVKVLVPADGSTPQILHHAPGFRGCCGHDILEFREHAVNDARHWLSRHKLLKQHELTSADDWRFYGTLGEKLCAFESQSLDVLVTFDHKSGAFSSFEGCLVKQGKVYRDPSTRLGARLFAKIVLVAAMRAKVPTLSGSRPSGTSTLS
jgi:hypothetical protein